MFLKSKEKKENVFEKEADRIFSLCKFGMERHTILDILAKSCGFNHYGDIRGRGKKEFNEFRLLSLWELEEAEKTIVKKLKKGSEFAINNINFIQDEINKRKNNIINHDPFNLFEILSIMHLNNDSCHLINKDWSLNEAPLKAFLYWYSDSLDKTLDYNTDQTFFKEYKTHFKKHGNKTTYYLHRSRFDNFIQRGFSYATYIKEGKHSENADGFLFKLVFKLKNKEKTIDEIYQEIQKMIDYERNFHNKNRSDYDRGALVVQSPYLLKNENKQYIDELCNGEMILGHKKQFPNERSFSDKLKKKPKKITKKINVNEHTMSAGCAGSGITEAGLFQIIQDIQANKSVIYFENRDDSSITSRINNIAHMVNRRKDVVYLKLDNAEIHLTLEIIKDFFDQKKIVVIQMPDFCRADEKIVKRINALYKKIFNELKTYCKGKYSHSNIAVYMNELECAPVETLDRIKDLLDDMENNQVNFRLSCYDFNWRDRKEILTYLLENHIHHCKIMKCEDPTETLERFSMMKKESQFRVDCRDLKSLAPGEFFYAYKNDMDAAIYQAFYLGNHMSDFHYLNPPIYNNFK